MTRLPTSVLHLERRRVHTAQPLAARSDVLLSLHTTCMTITRSRIIPQVTVSGTTEIPLEAFVALRDLVENEFNANIVVHDHRAAGEYHGGRYIDVPHYELDLTAEINEIDGIIMKIDPLIETLIERHTRQVALPTER